MNPRIASIVFVSVLLVAGCGKDKADKPAANDSEVISQSAKPLVPGAGYHSETAGTASKRENVITSDPSSEPAEPDDDAKPDDTKPDDTKPDDTKPVRDRSPDRAEPTKQTKKKSSGGGSQNKSLGSGVGGLKLNDIAIAPNVVERVPQDVKRRYSEAPEVFWCWTNFTNTGEELKVTHVWRHKNKVRSKIEVTVGNGKRWRSWSRHHPGDKSGEWSCEVLDPDGKRLGRASVTVGG